MTGAEGGEDEDAALSSQGKMQIKAGQSKMKNKKQGYVFTDVITFLSFYNDVFYKASTALGLI